MIVVNIKTDKYDLKGCRTPKNEILEPPHWSCIGNPYFLKNINDDEERNKVCDEYEKYFSTKNRK